MANSEALLLLQDIRATALANAAPLPTEQAANIEWQGLGFQIGGVRVVCSMEEVSEVMNLPRTTPLPVVRHWVLGVANVRGRLVPIIDLHRFLGLQPTRPRPDWRVVVVEDDDLVAGFVIEQSLGIQHLPDESFSEAPEEEVAEALRPFVTGMYAHTGRVFFEFALRSVLRAETFFDVSA
ncbi:MAG: chemotaxis protein CheW [Pseudomonadales bacterium]|jgi:twitching motility protein PilI|nr:chemotaxis protein CheW [Pseudomonadales bacterium]MDP6469468.1 chemotaxis protein CheW [Pseudomonadales bacterium]MDP6827310.1 chemotaxis protein CheW [Pseudomonadales bacterium]MDP6971133.1 chemotaxis protein CheW [Pseudomonadales bacterium]|tara:strand:- start:479 stop:1018 length:540 start_codon:yes stop_codon:yes gene_type:complete